MVRTRRLALALAIEAAFGYPDALYRALGHPVTWIGRMIAALDRGLNRGGATARRMGGVLALVVVIVCVGAVAFGLAAAAGLAGAVLSTGPVGAGLGFALVGVGVANVVPVLFSAAGSRGAAGVAMVATVGYGAVMGAPPLLGFVAGALGLDAVVARMPALAAAVRHAVEVRRVPDDVVGGGELGLRLGVDYSLTTSCYDPSESGEACGHCDACQLRLRGFEDAGATDPVRYASEARSTT